MTRTRRIFNIIAANLAIQGALILMLIPEEAFLLIAIGVGFMLTYRGLRFIIYYLTHANHMVGGKRILLVGLILFDLGDRCPFRIQDLAPQRQDRLERRIAALLGGTAGRIALDQKQFQFGSIP